MVQGRHHLQLVETALTLLTTLQVHAVRAKVIRRRVHVIGVKPSFLIFLGIVEERDKLFLLLESRVVILVADQLIGSSAVSNSLLIGFHCIGLHR